MEQLEKAKEKMRETGSKGATYELIAESLYSIAISLDEKNKLDREGRAKDEERMKESYDQSERMVKKVEELKEAQRKNNEPQNPTCYYCGKEITGQLGQNVITGGPVHANCFNEKHKRQDDRIAGD